MTKPAARIDDAHDCSDHAGGKITKGSHNVFIENIAAARVGDKSECKTGDDNCIAAGSSTVFINGKAAARQGDAMNHGGNIVNGASNVFIGSAGNKVCFGDKGIIHIGGNGNSVFIGGRSS